MNSCILMAQIVSNPELRSTQDQTSVSSMLVEFPSSREGEDPGKVQVEGWGNLAEEIKNTYGVGDRIIIEGRLSMNLFEMKEGYKEKRAKLVASKIYAVASSESPSFAGSRQGYQTSGGNAGNGDNMNDFAPSSTATPATAAPVATPAAPASSESSESSSENWDEIPF